MYIRAYTGKLFWGEMRAGALDDTARQCSGHYVVFPLLSYPGPYVSLCVPMCPHGAPLYVALYVSSYCAYIVLICVLTQVPRVSICVLICVLVCDKCVLTYILILS